MVHSPWKSRSRLQSQLDLGTKIRFPNLSFSLFQSFSPFFSLFLLLSFCFFLCIDPVLFYKKYLPSHGREDGHILNALYLEGQEPFLLHLSEKKIERRTLICLLLNQSFWQGYGIPWLAGPCGCEMGSSN